MIYNLFNTKLILLHLLMITILYNFIIKILIIAIIINLILFNKEGNYIFLVVIIIMLIILIRNHKLFSLYLS